MLEASWSPPDPPPCVAERLLSQCLHRLSEKSRCPWEFLSHSIVSYFCTDQSEKGSSWSCKRTQWPVSLQNRYLPHIWMFASLIHYRQSPKPTLQNVQNTLHLGKVHLFLKLPLRLLPLFPPTLPQVLRRLYLGSMFECLMFKFNKNQKVVNWFYLVAMFWCFLWIPQSRCS